MMRDPDRDNTAANAFQFFMRGWKHGACAATKDPRFATHDDPRLVEAYDAGYASGRGARNAAQQVAAGHYGHTITVLRQGTY